MGCSSSLTTYIKAQNVGNEALDQLYKAYSPNHINLKCELRNFSFKVRNKTKMQVITTLFFKKSY